MEKSGYGPKVLVSAIELAGDRKYGLARSIEFARPNNYCSPITGALLSVQTEHY